MAKQFRVIIERDSEGNYIARVPELPGCRAQANSPDALKRQIERAIELYLKEHKEIAPCEERKIRDIQLEFICPGCGLEGQTPEVTFDEAMGLIRGELQLRCPACRALLSMRATQPNLMAQIELQFLSEPLEALRGFARLGKRVESKGTDKTLRKRKTSQEKHRE